MQAIDTSPLNTGSANFETRRWSQVDNDTIMIRGSRGYYLFAAVFFLIGDGLVTAGILKLAGIFGSDTDGSLILILVGAVFLPIGVFLYRDCNRQTIINRELGLVRVKQWLPVKPENIANVILEILPAQITGIQSLQRIVSDKNKSYKQHQVNLVLDAGKRENVLLSLKKQNAKALADSIANMFGVPHHACLPSLPGRTRADKTDLCLRYQDTVTNLFFR